MVGGHAVTAAFGGHQLLLLLYPAVRGASGQLGPPPPQGLGRSLGCPGAVRTVGAATGLMWRYRSVPGWPVSVLAALAQQRGGAKAGLCEGVGKGVSPAEGQVDRLLFQQAQADTAGSASSLVPLSGPGLAGGPAVGAEVVVKEPGQVAGILQNDQ